MIYFVFGLGLFIGSFLNVCIARIPAGESVVFPPSRCPGCGKKLGAAELVPVLSYLVQRGRCCGCRGVISRRYPAVELMTALVLAMLYTRFGGSEFVLNAVFYAVLIVVFFIDLEHQIIPNRLVLVLTGLFFAGKALGLGPSWQEALLGSLLGGGLFLALAVVSGGGMGGGDIKLITAFGLWFGWAPLLLLMFLAFLFGGLVGGVLLLLRIKKRKDGIAFGPFLVLAAFLTGMWGRQLLEWYARVSGF